MLLFVSTTTRKRIVISTCRHFKLSWNTTALSQSNRRNFSCSSIKVCNNTHVMGSINLSYWYLFCTHRSTFQSVGARPPRSGLKQVQKGTGFDQASSRIYQALKQRGEGHWTMVHQTWKTWHDPWLLRLLLRYLLRSNQQCEDPRQEKLFQSNQSNSQIYHTHGRPKWW